MGKRHDLDHRQVFLRHSESTVLSAKNYQLKVNLEPPSQSFWDFFSPDGLSSADAGIERMIERSRSKKKDNDTKYLRYLFKKKSDKVGEN